MATRTTKLTTFAWLGDAFEPCGLLTLTEDGNTLVASEFAYGLRYLQRQYRIEVDPVSLSLGHLHQVEGNVLFPANRLPFFGGIRDASPDSWGRRVIESKLKAPVNSLPESTYLLEAGGNRVGALDIRRDRNAPILNGINSEIGLGYLMEAADRIEAGEEVPARLEAIFTEGTALGGARPKATVRGENGCLQLAKFLSRTDRFDMPKVEMAALRLAAECGLAVPPVGCVDVGGRSVMLIHRFDRYWSDSATTPLPREWMLTQPGDGPLERRIPFISALTLVGCSEEESRLKSYMDIAQGVRTYIHPDMVALNLSELFGRMVFNIFVSNDDDHLRNHGFIYDDGLKGWRLSPLYDVMPRPGVAQERQLHLGVGQQGKLATLDNALSACAAFGLSEAQAVTHFAAVWSKVREWKVFFEEYGVASADITAVESAFRHVRDIASPDLVEKIF